ncbi:MAG: hypothetical protein AAF936_07445 [Pseudomonadota bacterium]
MISKQKTLRPAWRGMEFWKWPAILLLLFCIGIIYPYAQGAGGSNGMSAKLHSAELHECPVNYELRHGEGAATVLGRVAPRCAVGLSPPTLAIIDAHGEPIAETVMRGDPNGLRARIEIPNDFDAKHMQLAIFSADTNGLIDQVDITDALTAKPDTQQED